MTLIIHELYQDLSLGLFAMVRTIMYCHTATCKKTDRNICPATFKVDASSLRLENKPTRSPGWHEHTIWYRSNFYAHLIGLRVRN